MARGRCWMPTCSRSTRPGRTGSACACIISARCPTRRRCRSKERIRTSTNIWWWRTSRTFSVMPAGEYVNETLLARLSKRLGNADLVPIHRSIASPPGWCLGQPRAATPTGVVPRAADRQALRGDLPGTARARVSLRRQLCMVPGEPFFLMREGDGEPNSETLIEVLERRDHLWRYAMTPSPGASTSCVAYGDPRRRHLQRSLLSAAATARRTRPDDYSRPLARARLALPRSAEW